MLWDWVILSLRSCLQEQKWSYEAFQHVKVKVAQLCLTLQPHGLYNPWNSAGQSTGVGSCSLLQGISPTQGLNPGLPYCGKILYQLSHKGSPRMLEGVAYAFSSRSSWTRNQTGVSCIAGRFFISWATREAHRMWLFKDHGEEEELRKGLSAVRSNPGKCCSRRSEQERVSGRRVVERSDWTKTEFRFGNQEFPDDIWENSFSREPLHLQQW